MVLDSYFEPLLEKVVYREKCVYNLEYFVEPDKESDFAVWFRWFFSSSSCHWFPVWCLRCDSSLGCLGSHDFWGLWCSGPCRWHAKATWHVDSCCCSCVTTAKRVTFMLTHLHTLNEKEAERVGGGKWRKFIYNALPQVLKPTTLCNTPHPSTHPSSCYTSLLTDSHFDTHAPISGFHRPEKLLDLAIQLLSPARLHRIAFEIHALYIFIVFFFPPSVLLYFLRVCPWIPLWLLIYQRFDFGCFWSHSKSDAKSKSTIHFANIYCINMQVMRRVRRNTIDGLTWAW